MKFNLVSLFFVVVFIYDSDLQAQSENYWSWNFNTPSTLLGGAVTGGSAGPSAVYYNPALIDQENISNFSLSANLISLQFFKAENIAGEGYDAEQFVFKVQPRFISYTLDNKNEKLGVELAILSPVADEIRYTGEYTDELDVIERTSGDESYSGYLNYARKYDDTWVGGGLSYRFSEQFYIGMSGFLSAKRLNYQYILEAKAYQEGDSVEVNGINEARYIASTGFQEEFTYWYLSFIFKLGSQYRTANSRFSIGVNFTLPDLPLLGKGNVRKEIGRANIYNDLESEFISNENIIGLEEDIAVRIKSPFSAALGMQYITANKMSAISFTMEYFHKINPYAIVESSYQASWLPAYLSSGLSYNDFLSYSSEAAAITNFAVGFKQIISPSFYLLAGFRTDFTASIAGNEVFIANTFAVNQIQIDKYHITLGPVWKFMRYNIVTGLQYTMGRNGNAYQVINYSNPVEYNASTDQSLVGIGKTNAAAALNELSMFFGLSIDLNH